VPPRPPPPQTVDGTLRGIPCASGVARGRALVVRDPRSAPETAGRVLVAETTDPGWVFLLAPAAALVVEKGSLLSHTAIIGRELGVPTVVNVPGATERIPDGALVEVDGSSGEVRLLEEPAAEAAPNDAAREVA
jgi:pyruvate,water dikinase